MKGLLILFVIWHHIYTVRIDIGIENLTFDRIAYYRHIYNTFFMPAFFCITGYCSNFHKPFYVYLKNNIKGILIPALLLGSFVGLLTNGFIPLKTYIGSIILYGCGNWFLGALFFTKMIVWYPLSRDKYTGCLIGGLVLLILGTIIHELNLFPNIWYFKQAFCLSFFMALGAFQRNRQLSTMIFSLSTVIYSLSLITSYVYLGGAEIPYVTYAYKISIEKIPLFLILSITGTITLWGISKIIGNNTFLEYLGKNTIIIYIVHCLFITIIEKILFDVLDKNDNFIVSVCLFVGIFIVVLLLSIISICVINSKYLRWSIGKF